MIAALVPAAGLSRRMGRPKLTLPIAGGGSVLDRVLASLRLGGAEPVLVVAPPRDQPGAADLTAIAERAGAVVLTLDAPTPDMRATVEAGLRRLERACPPPDALLLCPADSVGLTPTLVASVRDRLAAEPSALVIPTVDGRRGHPLGLPWDVARSIPELPPGLGVNALRQRFAGRVVLLDVAEPGATLDLDTPDDYRRWAPS